MSVKVPFALEHIQANFIHDFMLPLTCRAKYWTNICIEYSRYVIRVVVVKRYEDSEYNTNVTRDTMIHQNSYEFSYFIVNMKFQ
jgi:hypothetical protein